MRMFAGLPRAYYAAIAADPPWNFKARTALSTQNWWSRRDAAKHYRCMELEELAALPVGELAHADAHLFLWSTGPCLPQALELMAAWGFRYSAIAFTWIKLRRSFDTRQLRMLPAGDSDLHVGLGLTTRKNSELCLLGRRGNARRLAKDVREVVLAPIREHSRKPAEVYERIERYCVGPYLELFARGRRSGWDAWGDEVEKFTPRVAESSLGGMPFGGQSL